MKVAGFTFIRNAVVNDYPVVEAIKSILPICDEFVVAVGNCADNTRALVEAINDPKIRIVDTVWDDTRRDGGAVFALETDKAFAAISKDADWAFYIQGDECVHEKYLPVIKQAMLDNLHQTKVEGLLFKYLHFYGSYNYYSHSRRWYRREIRVVRNLAQVQSYRDAQGFRIDGRKLNVKLIDAYIYHYGWVKPPQGIVNKMRNFNSFYHDEEWLAQHNPPETYDFDYGNADKLIAFNGTHPAAMLPRIAHVNWKLNLNKVKSRMDTRRKVLQWVEDVFGWRIGEYKNYKLLK